MKDTFNILAVDPGNNIGIAIYEISNKDFSIVNIDTFTIVLSGRVVKKANIAVKITYLYEYFSNLLSIYNPVVVAEEAAFLNIRFPRAVMQLSQYIASIDMAIKTYDPDIKVFRYPPKLVKSKVGASGNADKDDMMLTVSNIKELNKHIDFKLITEHEVDSLAIGYVFLKEMRQYPELLIK